MSIAFSRLIKSGVDWNIQDFLRLPRHCLFSRLIKSGVDWNIQISSNVQDKAHILPVN